MALLARSPAARATAAAILARRDRDDDLDDLHRMLAGGAIDSPEKRARTIRVRSEFDVARRELNMQLRVKQDLQEFVNVRAKKGPKELVPRRGLVSESTATYLDLAESALRSSSTGDWERLQSYPMIVETFSDHHEIQQSLVVVTFGARHRRIHNNCSWTRARRGFSKIPT